MSDEPGRNDPCPCGSGEKYKHCCMNETAWYKNWLFSGAAIALVVTLALLAFGIMIFNTGQAPDCPPGEVWSAAHGHCH